MQVLRGHKDPTGMRKEVQDQESALTLKSMWEFEVKKELKGVTVSLSCVWCDRDI